MPVDFAARRKEAEKAGVVGGGDYLKLKEGANRMRLISECLPHKGTYQGKPTFKWLCLVIDRVDGKLKPYFMAHTIYKQIEALQLNEDYAFTEVPMPYDITVNAKGAGTKEVEYSVVPARKETPLTDDEAVAIDQYKSVAEVKKALDEKNANGRDEHDQSPPPHTDDDFEG
jgi:hypothetical protein